MSDTTESLPSAEAESVAEDTPKSKSRKTSPKNSMPRAEERKPYAVFGGGKRDDVFHDRAVPHKYRKSLTVLHVQRALVEKGYDEANADLGGRYGALTENAVRKYQADLGAEPTGVLTREQFEQLFDGDPNVVVH